MSYGPPEWRESLAPYGELLRMASEVCAVHGVRLAIVGGGVRDLLLGRGLRDLDLVVEGDAQLVVRELVRRHGGEARAHRSFGTACWYTEEGQVLDLASARCETYPRPGALPDVQTASLESDLERRDFSVNAMALLIGGSQEVLLDPHGGQEDLRQGQLRVLHRRSFVDDPTRIWRALRFASRLQMVLETQTRVHMNEALRQGCMKTLTLQRLGAELDRVFGEDAREALIARGQTWDLWGHISPSLREPEALQELSCTDSATEDPALSWLVLAAALPRPERERLLSLVPGGSSEQTLWMNGGEGVNVALEDAALTSSQSARSRIARVLERLETVELRLLVRRGGEQTRAWVEWWEQEGRAIKTPVDGRQLQELGFRPGPAIGRAKAAALDAARDGESVSVQLVRAQEVDRS